MIEVEEKRKKRDGGRTDDESSTVRRFDRLRDLRLDVGTTVVAAGRSSGADVVAEEGRLGLLLVDAGTFAVTAGVETGDVVESGCGGARWGLRVRAGDVEVDLNSDLCLFGPLARFGESFDGPVDLLCAHCRGRRGSASFSTIERRKKAGEDAPEWCIAQISLMEEVTALPATAR
jgi:hypothetical protein